MLLGQLNRLKLSLPLRALYGAGSITVVELLTGIIFNRNYTIWDYRGTPFNFLGQICLPYSLLWIPLSMFAMVLYEILLNALSPIG